MASKSQRGQGTTEESLKILPDLLDYDLRLVICGTAAGKRSAELGQYYAKQGNRFWKTLAEVGLTPHLLDPSEYKLLFGYGIGLTDLVRDKAGMDKDLIGTDFRFAEFEAKIQKFRPRFLCFNGKRAAQEYLREKKIEYGPQQSTIGETRLFVAPSTSAAARSFWDVNLWRQLAERSKS